MIYLLGTDAITRNNRDRRAICGTGILPGRILAQVVDPVTAQLIIGLITGMGE